MNKPERRESRLARLLSAGDRMIHEPVPSFPSSAV